DAGLVGISATSLAWATCVDVLTQIRERRPEVPVVVGNVHATLFDRYLLRRFPIDYAIRGEGELALVQLCEAIERGRGVEDVPNLTWRASDGRIVRNRVGALIDARDLGRAPLPDYSELPLGAYKGLAIESSRGCALDCSFCSTPYRKSWRGLEPETFVDRLEGMLAHRDRTRCGTVHVIDDEFSMQPSRAAAIARSITRRGLDVGLIYDSRALDFLRGDFAEEIAPLTHLFLIGAECGYDEGLARVGKGITVAMLEQAAVRLHELGIADKGEFSFILGLPWETRAEVDKTLRFAARLHAHYGVIVRLNWYTQVPGSRLWEEDRQRQVVSEAMYDEYGFYKNLYLLRTGVKLTPRDMWEVRDVVDNLVLVARLFRPEREQTFELFFPQAIERYFPRDAPDQPDDDRESTGLLSLRQLARPG
ncbi:MAG TPA: radical SAM protein, partial [Polyangiaceae bacterium]|nr:radical SAM protein [Polyangiaceae bacterium]